MCCVCISLFRKFRSFLMFQDNFMEEALKMRNLLEEFNQPHHGLHKPTILGVREHVFTGRSVSSNSKL